MHYGRVSYHPPGLHVHATDRIGFSATESSGPDSASGNGNKGGERMVGTKAQVVGHIILAGAIDASIVAITAISHITGYALMVVAIALIAGNSAHGISVAMSQGKLAVQTQGGS